MKDRFTRILPDILVKVALVALFCALLIFQFHAVFSTPIWRDDAFFASVAKNLILGNGYSAVFFDQNYLFNHGISIGPTLILPTALFIKIFGNSYWVPGFTLICFTTLQLIIIFSLADTLFRNREIFWKFLCYALFLIVVYTCRNQYGFPERFMLVWHALLGEIPSSFFVIMGALLVFSDQISSPYRYFGGGVLIGLGMLTKLFAIFAMVGIGIYLLLQVCRRRYLLVHLIWIGIGFVLPFLCFEATKLFILGIDGYSAILNQYAAFVGKNTVSVNDWAQKALYITAKTPGLRVIKLFFAVGGPAILFSIPLLRIITTERKNTAQREPLAFHFAMAMLCAGAVHISWWIACSSGGFRHVVPGLIYLCTSFAALMACVPILQSEKRQVMVPACVLLMLLGGPVVNYFFLGDYLRDDSSLIQEMQAVTDKITALQQENNVHVFSCGNNFELEYLLPGSNHFTDCRQMQAYIKNSNSSVILVTDYVLPDKMLFIYHDENYGIFSALPDEIRKLCHKEILRTERFEIAQCHMNAS